jgi:AraC-like DNA-binding protein
MNAPVTQAETLIVTPLISGEQANFFAAARFPGLDCLSARFSTHAYALHTHETYAIGAICAGCETWTARGRRHFGGPGDVAFLNPLDAHDGRPLSGEGYAYRMTYPTVELIREVASGICGRDVTETPFFPEPVVSDPEGAALFAAAHAALEAGGDALAGEELLIRAYALILVRHARLGEGPIARNHSGVARARALIEERFAEELNLGEIAAAAGLSRHHLVRAFRREVGLTPHAFVIDTRVRRAKARLRSGEAPAEVAAAVGFADQAHLTRAFKARLGVAPGAYRKAVG